jgi:Outer membrane protein beta-barrel domain
MLRKLSFILALCLLASVSAHAQSFRVSSFDVWGGYSYLRFRGTPAGNFNGFSLGAQYKFRSWLGAVADFGADYGSPTGVGSSVHTFLVGPQVSFPARVSPFAHVLFGVAHFSQRSFGDTSFSAGYGFGVDTKIAPSVSWRILEGDVIHTHFFGTTQNDFRLSTGLVIHF